MNGLKLLIDTNILIGLEDNKEITKIFSSLHQKCHQHGVQIFVHEASKVDIKRDKDLNRQNIILSKIEKFPPLENIPIPEQGELERIYGKISKSNDYIDVVLLYTLHEVGAIDFLITQDRGLHKRAAKVGIADRVFRVEDALVWLRDKYDQKKVALPYIEDKQCHQINRKDAIFSSLHKDYDGFDSWFQNSCVRSHRDCWTINFNDEIAGIAIRKEEDFDDLIRDIGTAENHFQNRPNKILKICTFKIREEYRGEKFGEQLIKQVLWWAHKNQYDFIYLTVYPKHKNLIDLLFQYGFESIGRTKGELYLGKTFSAGVFKTSAHNEPLQYHRQFYPAFLSDVPVGKFLIPIKSAYYETLFPENINNRQAGLFDVSKESSSNKSAGNTIRKVYVCHATTNAIKEGDILLFFHLKDDFSFHSQSIVTVGIVDGFDVTNSHEELLRLTAKRSVFNQKELVDLTRNGEKRVKVINFLLAGHINPAILMARLDEVGIKGAIQSIRKVSHEQFMALEKDIKLDVKTTI
jgi:ribosomal protein S18 acetylase RimI-like enzyme